MKQKVGKWKSFCPQFSPREKQKHEKLFEWKDKEESLEEDVYKHCFVGHGITRKLPEYERLIRPMGLCFKKDHVTHPELKAGFCLPVLGVKKNPSSPLHAPLGVLTKMSSISRSGVSDFLRPHGL